MPILGIENQTENWKTVQTFAPYHASAEARYRLAQRLVQPLGTLLDCQPQEIQLELFWNGMRDYLKVAAEWKELPNEKAKIKLYGSKFVDIYNELYTDLLGELRASQVTVSKERNYNVSGKEGRRKLYHHLHGTEFDVVLEAPGLLFLGEAKLGGSYNDSNDSVLRHQLVKQYVVANILLSYMGKRNDGGQLLIIPFVVSDKPDTLKKSPQAKFMIKRGWLKADNIMSWDDINELT